MPLVLKRDVTLIPWENIGCKLPVTFPKGAKVKPVGSGFVIESIALIVKLTGNSHDATHRYVWVKEQDIERRE